MATPTTRLSERSDLFKFQRDQRVARRDSAGHADTEYSGIVTDGQRTGSTSGGAYETVYTIKRDDGVSFQTREIELVRIFDEAALREHIRALLRAHKLPRDLPPPPVGELQGRETMRLGAGHGRTCSICEHQIPHSDATSVEYAYPSGVVRFDSRCDGIWTEERRR
jgi:hypothetical protein